MATIADYLLKLDALRDELARNLVLLGVAASEAETLQTLVPKLLKIPVGDTGREFADLAFLVEDFPCTFGFLSYDERASFVGITAVSGLNRIGRAVLTLRGSGVEALEITADGWTVQREAGTVTLSRTLPERTSRFELQDWIDTITLGANADVVGVATLAVFGADAETEYKAAGSMGFRFQRNSWAAIEAQYLTWGALEAAGFTWGGLEHSGKP